MKKARAPLLIFLLILALLLLFALLPGRTPYTSQSFLAYWSRIIWRLFNYQQLIAGILALLAGTAVVAAAVFQRNAQRNQAQIDNLRDQIDVANILIAEVRALIAACNEFEAKFSQNMSNFRNSRNLTGPVTIPLPLTSRVYEALMPDLKKLPVDISTAVVKLYAAYDVYRLYLMQAFDFASPDIQAQFDGLKKNISGEFRMRCETTNQTLEAFVQDLDARLQS